MGHNNNGDGGGMMGGGNNNGNGQGSFDDNEEDNNNDLLAMLGVLATIKDGAGGAWASYNEVLGEKPVLVKVTVWYFNCGVALPPYQPEFLTYPPMAVDVCYVCGGCVRGECAQQTACERHGSTCTFVVHVSARSLVAFVGAGAALVLLHFFMCCR